MPQIPFLSAFKRCGVPIVKHDMHKAVILGLKKNSKQKMVTPIEKQKNQCTHKKKNI